MASQGHWPETLDHYRRTVEVNPENNQPALGLAWILATCPDSTCRNGQEVLAILSRWQEKGATP